MMLSNYFTSSHRKSMQLCRGLLARASSFCQSTCNLILNSYYFVLLHVNSFWIQLCYFLFISLLGFLVLKVLKPRTSNEDSVRQPRDLDLFFTAISATTVSSMSTVEMEVFSNSQLIILTILMLVGGEVFTSMVGLRSEGSKFRRPWKTKSRINVLESLPCPPSFTASTHNHHLEHLEMGILSHHHRQQLKPKPEVELNGEDPFLRYRSIKLLGRVVSTYLVVVQAIGIIMVVVYLNIFTSAGNVVKSKGIRMSTFSVFTVVSTFASCGFIPTNENMVIFRRNSGLLLILMPQVLLGNTLFPSCLRFSIWILWKLTKAEETDYLLNHTVDVGYFHLLPLLHSLCLVFTVFGFIAVQWVLFCSAQWNSQALSGLNPSEKLIAALFQCVNSRHTGETIIDLSYVTPVILVLFVAMMYLPPYTSFIPTSDNEESQQTCGSKSQRRKGKLAENLLFSQLSYLLISVLAVCATERDSLQKDPLNFSVLNIVVEVISAYGNVGFSTGYSCARRLNYEGKCVDKSYGFSGKWTDEGKATLILVMVFGRLKKFNMEGGKAWKLL